MLLLALSLPLASLDAQRRVASLPPTTEIPGAGAFASDRAPFTKPLAVPSKSPFEPSSSSTSTYVLVGAIVGAMVGRLAYRRSMRDVNDQDHLAPVSVVIIMGGGAAIGTGFGRLIAPRPKRANASAQRGR